MFRTALAASQTQSALAQHRFDQRSDLEGEIARVPTRRLEAKEHVFLAGDPRAVLYKFDSGEVCLYRMVVSGRRQVTGFAFAGDIFGMDALSRHVLSAQALRTTRVQGIPIAARASGRQRPTFQPEAIRDGVPGARQHTAHVARHQASGAGALGGVSSGLGATQWRNGEEPEILILPMTRADIGDFLGLTIETVSRMFSKLQAEGVIGINSAAQFAFSMSENLRNRALPKKSSRSEASKECPRASV